VKVFSNEFRYCFTDEEGKFVVANVKWAILLKRRRGYITKFEPAAVNRDKPTNLVFELKLSITNNKAPTAPVLVSPLLIIINN
jgi:hypothetical protein